MSVTFKALKVNASVSFSFYDDSQGVNLENRVFGNPISQEEANNRYAHLEAVSCVNLSPKKFGSIISLYPHYATLDLFGGNDLPDWQVNYRRASANEYFLRGISARNILTSDSLGFDTVHMNFQERGECYIRRRLRGEKKSEVLTIKFIYEDNLMECKGFEDFLLILSSWKSEHLRKIVEEFYT